MTSLCTVDPLSLGKPNHSDDLVEVYHGCEQPAYLCGFHATHWPELAHQSVHYGDSAYVEWVTTSPFTQAEIDQYN